MTTSEFIALLTPYAEKDGAEVGRYVTNPDCVKVHHRGAQPITPESAPHLHAFTTLLDIAPDYVGAYVWGFYPQTISKL